MPSEQEEEQEEEPRDWRAEAHIRTHRRLRRDSFDFARARRRTLDPSIFLHQGDDQEEVNPAGPSRPRRSAPFFRSAAGCLNLDHASQDSAPEPLSDTGAGDEEESSTESDTEDELDTESGEVSFPTLRGLASFEAQLVAGAPPSRPAASPGATANLSMLESVAAWFDLPSAPDDSVPLPPTDQNTTASSALVDLLCVHTCSSDIELDQDPSATPSGSDAFVEEAVSPSDGFRMITDKYQSWALRSPAPSSQDVSKQPKTPLRAFLQTISGPHVPGRVPDFGTILAKRSAVPCSPTPERELDDLSMLSSPGLGRPAAVRSAELPMAELEREMDYFPSHSDGRLVHGSGQGDAPAVHWAMTSPGPVTRARAAALRLTDKENTPQGKLCTASDSMKDVEFKQLTSGLESPLRMSVRSQAPAPYSDRAILRDWSENLLRSLSPAKRSKAPSHKRACSASPSKPVRPAGLAEVQDLRSMASLPPPPLSPTPLSGADSTPAAPETASPRSKTGKRQSLKRPRPPSPVDTISAHTGETHGPQSDHVAAGLMSHTGSEAPPARPAKRARPLRTAMGTGRAPPSAVSASSAAAPPPSALPVPRKLAAGRSALPAPAASTRMATALPPRRPPARLHAPPPAPALPSLRPRSAASKAMRSASASVSSSKVPTLSTTVLRRSASSSVPKPVRPQSIPSRIETKTRPPAVRAVSSSASSSSSSSTSRTTLATGPRRLPQPSSTTTTPAVRRPGATGAGRVVSAPPAPSSGPGAVAATKAKSKSTGTTLTHPSGDGPSRLPRLKPTSAPRAPGAGISAVPKAGATLRPHTRPTESKQPAASASRAESAPPPSAIGSSSGQAASAHEPTLSDDPPIESSDESGSDSAARSAQGPEDGTSPIGSVQEVQGQHNPTASLPQEDVVLDVQMDETIGALSGATEAELTVQADTPGSAEASPTDEEAPQLGTTTSDVKVLDAEPLPTESEAESQDDAPLEENESRVSPTGMDEAPSSQASEADALRSSNAVRRHAQRVLSKPASRRAQRVPLHSPAKPVPPASNSQSCAQSKVHDPVPIEVHTLPSVPQSDTRTGGKTIIRVAGPKWRAEQAARAAQVGGTKEGGTRSHPPSMSYLTGPPSVSLPTAAPPSTRGPVIRSAWKKPRGHELEKDKRSSTPPPVTEAAPSSSSEPAEPSALPLIRKAAHALPPPPSSGEESSSRPLRAVRVRAPEPKRTPVPMTPAPPAVPSSVRAKSVATGVLPLSKTELTRLTNANTRRNEKVAVQLEFRSLTLDRPRPPSPSAHIPRLTQPTREQVAAERDARAQRRAGIESPQEDSDDEAGQWYEDEFGERRRRHRLGAGETSLYCSPLRPYKAKAVHWAPELFVGPADRHSTPLELGSQPLPDLGSARPRKSLLILPPAPLDRMGNVPDAAVPLDKKLSDKLKRTRVVIQKKTYADDR